MTAPYDYSGGRDLIISANQIRDTKSKETVVRENLVAHLQDMYPRDVRPWWLERHILGAEAAIKTLEEGKMRGGAVDSVVGLTVIEYEPDLRGSRFLGGNEQVYQYCAGLLNEGADAAKVRGVLSDGVEWYAYRVELKSPKASYGKGDLTLIELEHLTLATADDENVDSLAGFLQTYLGRPEVRPLSGSSIAGYFGLESAFGQRKLAELSAVLRSAQAANPRMAEMIRDLWGRLAGYLDAGSDVIGFDSDAYLQEFYLSILAKLICLNVIKRRATTSPYRDVDTVLSGEYFEDAGLDRFVEHDYFGWLHEGFADEIRPTALAIQADLTAYDFEAEPNDDLFGQLMAELAEKSRRLLLGQEWTPAWLAKRMAQHLIGSLPADTDPHFIDMCCGSGSMLVEVAKCAQEQLVAAGVDPGSSEAIRYLARAAVGFDIDPLAVILAKVNWVATNRSWLSPFDGSNRVSVPVYHADSLFGLTPLGGSGAPLGTNIRLRLLDDTYVDLPAILLDPARQETFDGLISGAYELARPLAKQPEGTPVDAGAVELIVEHSFGEVVASESELASVTRFLSDLASELANLQRGGMNGIWTFILRNTYRPELLTGQFNGLISNPPWLALSRIGGNPLRNALKELANQYALVPSGASFLHLELATTFLVRSMERYLTDDALVACVLPSTVMNGHHHESFRAQLGGISTPTKVALVLSEVWLLEKRVFQNRALVLCGKRGKPSAWQKLPAVALGPEVADAVEIHATRAGGAYMWRTSALNLSVAHSYGPAFRQGADVMPRTLFFVAPGVTKAGKTTIGPISRSSSLNYLLSGAKKCPEFRPKSRTVSQKLIHKCLVSQHLAPFFLAEAGTVLAPCRQNASADWELVSEGSLAADPSARRHFTEIVAENVSWAQYGDIWTKGLNMRSKLVQQRFGPRSWIIVFGAGGGIPAVAFTRGSRLRDTVIDQTLYWAEVSSLDEALYISGLGNSDVMLARLEGLLPEGEFSDRHIHKWLPRAIPQFDSDDPDHMAVAVAVRVLRKEVGQVARTDPKVARLLTTGMSMSARRTRLRRVIRGRDGFRKYDESCSTVLS